MTRELRSLLENAGSPRFEIGNREVTLLLIHEVDLEAQILVIEDVLYRTRKEDDTFAARLVALVAEIRETASGYAGFLKERWIDYSRGCLKGRLHSASAVTCC